MASDPITEAAAAYREAHIVAQEATATAEQMAAQARDAESLQERAWEHAMKCRKDLLAACLDEANGR